MRARPRYWGGVALALLAIAGLTCGVIGWVRTGDFNRYQPAAFDPVGREAFDRWLAADAERPAQFAQFERFLIRRDADTIVPAWTLLRADRASSRRCGAEPFVMPPRAFWPNIIPALHIVRRHVVPAIGRVRVASTMRDAHFNRCARGASASRHLRFHAIDLEPLDQPDIRAHFATLCAVWRRAGQRSGWGFGAYYDHDRPARSRTGRFHVDATGWRSWGYSYGAASSACRQR